MQQFLGLIPIQYSHKWVLNRFDALNPNLGSKKYSTPSFRNIRGFLANWAFFAVFSILNRKKQNFGNLTFKNENIDHNNDLEKRKSEKS